MISRAKLRTKILNKINEGCADVDAIAEDLGDGRIYEEVGKELSNVISWIDFKGDEKVLQINAGCGVITGYLADVCSSVDALIFEDESLKVNVALNESHDNISYLKELENGEAYDRIIICALVRKDKEDIKDVYKRYIEYSKSHIRKAGSIYIVFENRFGLDSWKGKGREDGRFTSLFEDEGEYVSRRDIIRLLEATGLKYTEYYPYPNHKFTRILYSKERLPKRGELLRYYHDNFSYSNWELFNESAVFDKLIDEEVFPVFSNSYLIAAGETVPDEPIIYSKYSTDRAEMFCICTELVKDENGLVCKKRPLNDSAREHIRNLENIEKKLSQRFGEDVVITSSKIEDGCAISPFVKGRILQSILEDCHRSKNSKEAFEILDRYSKIIYSGCTTVEFEPTPKFAEVFGNVDLKGKYDVSDITDIDLNFDNIIVSDRWYIIDYEWSFDFPIPQKFVLYRALKQWNNASVGKIIKSWDEWMSFFDISRNEQNAFEEMEEGFQRYVAGEKKSFGDISGKYKKDVYFINEIDRCLNNEELLLKRIEYLEKPFVKENIFKRLFRGEMVIKGNMDDIFISENEIRVRGWVFIYNFNRNEENVLILSLRKNITGEVLELGKLKKELRIDISNSFPDQINIYDSGFTGSFENTFGITYDDYKVGVIIHNERLRDDKEIWF